jgi:hypothetical protein
MFYSRVGIVSASLRSRSTMIPHACESIASKAKKYFSPRRRNISLLANELPQSNLFFRCAFRVHDSFRADARVRMRGVVSFHHATD